MFNYFKKNNTKALLLCVFVLLPTTGNAKNKQQKAHETYPSVVDGDTDQHSVEPPVLVEVNPTDAKKQGAFNWKEKVNDDVKINASPTFGGNALGDVQESLREFVTGQALFDNSNQNSVKNVNEIRSNSIGVPEALIKEPELYVENSQQRFDVKQASTKTETKMEESERERIIKEGLDKIKYGNNVKLDSEENYKSVIVTQNQDHQNDDFKKRKKKKTYQKESLVEKTSPTANYSFDTGGLESIQRELKLLKEEPTIVTSEKPNEVKTQAPEQKAISSEATVSPNNAASNSATPTNITNKSVSPALVVSSDKPQKEQSKASEEQVTTEKNNKKTKKKNSNNTQGLDLANIEIPDLKLEFKARPSESQVIQEQILKTKEAVDALKAKESLDNSKEARMKRVQDELEKKLPDLKTASKVVVKQGESPVVQKTPKQQNQDLYKYTPISGGAIIEISSGPIY